MSASQAEIDYWQEHRPDIYRYVSNGEIWADPDSGVVLERCPFLYTDAAGRKLLCKIYNQRPDDCRFYPSTVDEMVSDGCEMIELKDLRNPRRAKKDLEELMSDSRFSTD